MFVHQTRLRKDGFQYLKAGELLKFIVVHEAGGKRQAVDVSRMGREAWLERQH